VNESIVRVITNRRGDTKTRHLRGPKFAPVRPLLNSSIYRVTHPSISSHIIMVSPSSSYIQIPGILNIQAANSQGIQTLLEAEKEAAKVVQKARQCKSFRHPSF